MKTIVACVIKYLLWTVLVFFVLLYFLTGEGLFENLRPVLKAGGILLLGLVATDVVITVISSAAKKKKKTALEQLSSSSEKRLALKEKQRAERKAEKATKEQELRARAAAGNHSLFEQRFLDIFGRPEKK